MENFKNGARHQIHQREVLRKPNIIARSFESKMEIN